MNTQAPDDKKRDTSRELRKRILCVEDDEDSCAILVTLLKLSGYEAEAAKSASEGLRLAGCGGFDLYLLDVRFPDGSGIDLCKQIRASDARAPIVFYTAAAFESDVRQGMNAGANAYLTKPAQVDELERIIAELLDKPQRVSAGEK